ncbi:hypothetical protein [Streptomyces mirabilis]|uniref:hypothetical protein n=1 Tax=Streptomyces TaxID=1883 RepID=UPI001161CC0C|nr:hypothetical protein FNV61_55765 [Streptomyces sp. RLB3-6]
MVKDRMDITGVRWGLDGGGDPALLKLRIVLSNGDFKAYWDYHMQRKHPRVHAVRYHYALELAA